MNKNKSRDLPCEIISLNKVYELAHRLSVQIKLSDFVPDVVVAIARGGFVPARLLCDFLQNHNLASVRVKHYAAGALMKTKATVIDPVNADVEYRKVLLVDDVNDTGESLLAALPHIESLNPAIVKTAVLHEKKNTACKAHYVSEHLAEWRWIIYQWALIEDVGTFLEEIQPVSLTQAKEMLKEKHNIDLSVQELQRISFFTNTHLTL